MISVNRHFSIYSSIERIANYIGSILQACLSCRLSSVKSVLVTLFPNVFLLLLEKAKRMVKNHRFEPRLTKKKALKQQKRLETIIFLESSLFFQYGRDDRIRTDGLLLPKQTR